MIGLIAGQLMRWTLFREFGDFEGTYQDAMDALQAMSIRLNPNTFVRRDAFTRRGKVVHRLYFTSVDDHAIFFSKHVDSFTVKR